MNLRARTSAQFALGATLALLLVSPALASDTPSAPTPLSFGSTAYFDTSSYGIADGEQNTTAPFPNRCGGSNDVGVARTAWFTVEGTGGPITVTTTGSNYDTAMFVYAGSPAGPVVTCNDDSSSELQAAVAFSSAAATTYAIQVGRACNDGATPNCAATPSAGALTIRADGTAPPTPPPPPGPGEPPSPPPPTPPAILIENRLAPAIDGVAARGAVVTCAPGEWLGPQPLTYTTEWLRSGKVVGHGPRYRVVKVDVRRRLVCKVTASGQGASASAVSEGVTPVAQRRQLVVIPMSGGVEKPLNAPARKGCRATLSLTLYKGRTVLARRTVLMNDQCRWSWRLPVSRARLGASRKLRLRVHHNGNPYFNARTWYDDDVRVPRR